MSQQQANEVNHPLLADNCLEALGQWEWSERIAKLLDKHVDESIRELKGISSRALQQG